MNPNDPTTSRSQPVARTGTCGCPSEMDLAAWLDGRADETLAERIIVHLASCPTCLEATRDSSFDAAQPDDGMVFVPDHVINAAMNLVNEPALATITVARRNAAMWFTFGRRSAAAAAIVAIAVLGNHVGGSLSAASSSSTALGATTQSAATNDPLSFGLLDDTAESTSTVDLLQAVLASEAVQ